MKKAQASVDDRSPTSTGTKEKAKIHYLPNGKIYKGPTHMTGGKKMTGKTHTDKSVMLTHTKPKK